MSRLNYALMRIKEYIFPILLVASLIYIALMISMYDIIPNMCDVQVCNGFGDCYCVAELEGLR